VKYLVDLLNLKQVGAFLVEDLTSSWKHILVAFGLASALSVGEDAFIMIFLIKKLNLFCSSYGLF
jgi:hypothetical protein